MKQWFPMDGDSIVTRENFIFYAFGYEHPEDSVLSFLKYIPSKFKPYFPLRFLEQSWRLRDIELARPEKLYTAQNFQKFMETFRRSFPQYVYFCPFRGKDVMGVPLRLVKRVYVPRECLQRLFERKRKDGLQKLALDLTSLLSTASGVPLEDFGVHGSLALNMHTEKSDVDLVVYGSRNFRSLEGAVDKLVEEGTLKYVFTKRLDRVRKHRGRYKDKRFVYNAVRKTEEIGLKYGDYRYFPVKPVTFSCEVVDDTEAMFRPAVYQIADYEPLDSDSRLGENEAPTRVVSMIGYYRNVARRGDRVKVSGMLERVEKVETGETHHQVVVGSGTREDEYVATLKSRSM